MGLLNKNQIVGNYFPSNTSTIIIGTLVRWHLYLYNHMITANNVSIRVKILNSTQLSPNSTSGKPSPVTPFININQKLAANETKIIPFFFNISKVIFVNNSISILDIKVNNITYSVDTSAFGSRSFRLVFELWSYDESLKIYIFSWKSSIATIPVWNQIRFDVVSNI